MNILLLTTTYIHANNKKRHAHRVVSANRNPARYVKKEVGKSEWTFLYFSPAGQSGPSFPQSPPPSRAVRPRSHLINVLSSLRGRSVGYTSSSLQLSAIYLSSQLALELGRVNSQPAPSGEPCPSASVTDDGGGDFRPDCAWYSSGAVVN